MEPTNTNHSNRELDPKLDSITPPEKEPTQVGKYSAAESAIITARLDQIAGLGTLVGGDTTTQISLNTPGEGWHWNFATNEIKVDPEDLLHKSLEECQFIIMHEGWHRALSRVEGIVAETLWQEPGYAFMTNAIEDPRINNYGYDTYPNFRAGMLKCYQEEGFDFEQSGRQTSENQLGYVPKHIEAGLAYISAWFADLKGDNSPDFSALPPDVQTVVEETLPAVLKSSRVYPTFTKARSEAQVLRYASASHQINATEVWPQFKKLVEADINDQAAFNQALKEFSEGQDGPGSFSQSLSPEALKELIETLKQGLDQNQQMTPWNELSEETKQELQKWFESLPEDLKRQLKEAAAERLKTVSDKIAKELEGKLEPQPFSPESRERAAQKAEREAQAEKRARQKEELEKSLKSIADHNIDTYSETRSSVFATIQKLTSDLQEAFSKNSRPKQQSGYRSGTSINIKHWNREQMQAEAKQMPHIRTRAFERKITPQKADYAFSLLVDLSGSMRGEKINEAVKATIVLTEMLSKLGIKHEIVGFNSNLYIIKTFDQVIRNPKVRTGITNMINETTSSNAGYNDDGWALRKVEQSLLQNAPKGERFLLVLSDGEPSPSSIHSGAEYNLKTVAQKIEHAGQIQLLGLGLGPHTDHVNDYYSHSIANIAAQELPSTFGKLLKNIIIESQKRQHQRR